MAGKFNRCFCALALGEYYRELALELSADLARTVPDTPLLLLTDAPGMFDKVENTIALRHEHRFGYRPYNDKVFVLEEALERFSTAIQIDVDTKVADDIREKIDRPWPLGITGISRNLLEHTKRYNPRDLPGIEAAGDKLGISIDKARWVGESLFVVREDGGREREFIETWKKLARYWDLHKLAAKDGTLIGLAAAKAGWEISFDYWEELKNSLAHFDAHRRAPRDKYRDIRQQWGYRARILRMKIATRFRPDLLP